jgi:hypothetical protein
MVQILQENRQPSTSERFGKAFANVGQVAGEKVPEMLMRRKEKEELNNFADQLEKNNPNSPSHKTIADIYRSNLSMDDKSQMVKALTGVDPFKMEQQKRLQLDSVLKRYNNRIKEEQTKLKDTARSSDRESINELIKNLQSERDQLLGFESIGDENDILEDEMSKPKKPVLDPKNKEHVKKYKQLFKKFKGDQEKINAALAKEFSL